MSVNADYNSHLHFPQKPRILGLSNDQGFCGGRKVDQIDLVAFWGRLVMLVLAAMILTLDRFKPDLLSDLVLMLD